MLPDVTAALVLLPSLGQLGVFKCDGLSVKFLAGLLEATPASSPVHATSWGGHPYTGASSQLQGLDVLQKGRPNITCVSLVPRVVLHAFDDQDAFVATRT